MKQIKQKQNYALSLFVVQKGDPQKQVLEHQVFSRRWFAEVWLVLLMFYYSDVVMPGLVHLEHEIKPEAI